MEKELQIIEEYYPGVEVLISDEVNSIEDFESLHDYQLFIALQRKMAIGWDMNLQELYDEILRSTRGGGRL